MNKDLTRILKAVDTKNNGLALRLFERLDEDDKLFVIGLLGEYRKIAVG